MAFAGGDSRDAKAAGSQPSMLGHLKAHGRGAHPARGGSCGSTAGAGGGL